MKQNKETLKTYFETGDKPTQEQYAELIDSYVDAKQPVGEPNRRFVIDELGEVSIAPEVKISEYTLSEIVGNKLSLLKDGLVVKEIDLTTYLDDTNLSRLVSGTVDPTGIATFKRDDNSTFTVDFSSLVGNSVDQIQADWNQTDATQADFIKNKPALSNLDLLKLKAGYIGGVENKLIQFNPIQNGFGTGRSGNYVGYIDLKTPFVKGFTYNDILVQFQVDISKIYWNKNNAANSASINRYLIVFSPWTFGWLSPEVIRINSSSDTSVTHSFKFSKRSSNLHLFIGNSNTEWNKHNDYSTFVNISNVKMSGDSDKLGAVTDNLEMFLTNWEMTVSQGGLPVLHDKSFNL